MPNSSGMKSSATSGSDAARRLEHAAARPCPTAPPDRCCSISSAREPSDRPRQKRKPISQDRKNWSGFIDARRSPPAPGRATPTMQRPLLEAARAPARRWSLRVSAVVTSRVPASRRRARARRRRRLRRALPRSPPGTSAVGGVLAELQRADVGDDRPAIARRRSARVVRHRAEAVGHHVEEVAGLRVAQPVVVERRRLLDSRAARPCRCRCRSAPWQGVQKMLKRSWPRSSTACVDRERQLRDRRRRRYLAGEERVVVLQRAARDRALDERPRDSAVGEERRSPRSGRYRGWSCMSWRQPATPAAAPTRRAAARAPASRRRALR